VSFHNRCLKDFVAHERFACFYFDLAEIEKRARQLIQLASPQVRFIFPVKSFPNPEVLKIMAHTHMGFDVSNQTELEQVRPFVKSGDTLWSSSPVPWNTEIPGMLMDGGHLGAPWPEKATRSLRVCFHEKKAGFVSRFGVDLSELTPAMLSSAKLSALHFHQGQEPFNREGWIKAVEHIGDLVRSVPEISQINLGGGFANLTSDELGCLIELARKKIPDRLLYFEPGRWICGEAGKLLGRVTDCALFGQKAVVTSTLSRDCHLRWQRRRFEINLHPMKESEATSCTELLIGGATCHEGDSIGHLVDGRWSVARGDLIVVNGVSGYSLSWNHGFNGITAAEVQFIE